MCGKRTAYQTHTETKKFFSRYVGKIQIKQDYNKFITDFKIDNLYERCTGITLIPEFKEIDFDGKQYVMDKFSKNKKYTEYPIEIVYRRRLEDL